MAQPIPCDICQQTTADFVVTVAHDGQVVGVGVECLLDWALPIAEAYQEAVAREQGGPGTVQATAGDPPDMAVIPVSDGPDSPAQPTEPGTGTVSPSGQKSARRGRSAAQTAE